MWPSTVPGDSQRGRKRSPGLAWELELEEPEELPLPGRGCSFSTRSHSGRCSTLLSQRTTPHEQAQAPIILLKRFKCVQLALTFTNRSGGLFTYPPALLGPAWLPGCDGRGDSRRDSTGDLDVVLTGTWRKQIQKVLI